MKHVNDRYVIYKGTMVDLETGKRYDPDEVKKLFATVFGVVAQAFNTFAQAINTTADALLQEPEEGGNG